jgi:kumamolisin
VGGEPFVGNGTSASAPLWAGLIALLNAALGHNVGFVNPALYLFGFNEFEGVGSPFRGVDFFNGPTDNSNGGVKGYPAGFGWDACKGLGTPNGTTILAGLKGQIGPRPM